MGSLTFIVSKVCLKHSFLLAVLHFHLFSFDICFSLLALCFPLF